MDKLIQDWTLGELQEFCRNRADKYGDDCCNDCPVTFCMSTPDEWAFKTAVWKAETTYACSRCGYRVIKRLEECPECHSTMES